LRARFIANGGEARLHTIDSTPWPTLEEAIPLDVPAGSLVVFDGLLPHYSAPNRSPHSRHAYTLHAVDGRAAYSPKNWLQRSTLPPRGF
ncbi:MAG: phytanoyl-CoA dioxygenase family protein, partial [Candidatus Aquilonibacter sp.]